jgi:MoaA/NifB/PqqE/SkfB family radical SAM enzyme
MTVLDDVALREREPPSGDDQTYLAPAIVDFNVNGVCNLHCAWCWGPGPQAREDLSGEDWKQIARFLHSRGTKRITITGGEPLLKRDLVEILRYLHDELSLSVTLATNGILLQREASTILPYVDSIGLPLDGPTQEVVERMRVGSSKYFHTMLENIKFIQDRFPHILVTVRTVVSRKNAEAVPFIGKTMLDFGIDPERMRWKCYQITPIRGSRGEVIDRQWLLSESEFEEVLQKIRKENPEFANLCVLSTDMHVGRYFHIYPNGNTHVFVTGKDGFPDRFPLGNMGRDPLEVLKKLKQFDFTNNTIR